MDLIITFLAAMSGALVGASVGVYILSPRLRPDRTELDAMRSNLQSNEFSLKAAEATIEKLHSQAEEQAKTIQQNSDLLTEKDEQFQSQATKLGATEQRLEEVLREAVARNEAAAGTDPGAKADSERTMEELRQRLASYETEMEGVGKQVQQWAEKANGAESESAALRQRLASYETELEGVGKQVQQWVEKANGAENESAALRQRWEQEAQGRAALEEQLSRERKQAEELAGRIAQQESQLAQAAQQLQEERQSAASRMELLVKAQESLSQFVEAAGATKTANGHGNGNHWQPAPATAETEPAAVAQAAETDPVSALS